MTSTKFFASNPLLSCLVALVLVRLAGLLVVAVVRKLRKGIQC